VMSKKEHKKKRTGRRNNSLVPSNGKSQ